MRKMLATALVGMCVWSPAAVARQTSLPLASGLAGGRVVTHTLSDTALREVMLTTGEQAQQASPSKAKGRPVKIGAGVGLLLGAAVVAPAMCHAWGGCAGEGVHPGVAVALFGGIGAGIGAAIGYVVSRR
jgi:hypothetical protein